MRAVLRTLAQCHSHHLLHRDVKPGNFMLASDDEAAPLKAIDFGLAVPFDPAALPMTELGLEGTPWCVLGLGLGLFLSCAGGAPFLVWVLTLHSATPQKMRVDHSSCSVAWHGACIRGLIVGSACCALPCKRADARSACWHGAVRSGGCMQCMAAHGCARAGSWRRRC